MSDREQAWFRLLLDCLSEGQPSGRLLVRYLLDPCALTDDEQSLLEHRVETDAQVADQLEVMRGVLTGGRPLLDARPRPTLPRGA